MAFDENLIDFVIRLPAVAGRTAGPHRRLELQAWRFLPPHPPAGETPGLARQIRERGLEGLEPPAEAFCIDKAIGRRSGIGGGRARCPQGRHPGIASEDMDAWGITRECSAARQREVFPRIEELKGGSQAPALPDWPRRHGARRSKFHYKAARRDDDKAPHGGFGGPEQAQHGSVEGLRNPRHRGGARKPQHGEKDRNYPNERFAVAFDGPGPVHGVSLSNIKNKQGTFEPIGIDCQGDLFTIWVLGQWQQEKTICRL